VAARSRRASPPSPDSSTISPDITPARARRPARLFWQQVPCQRALVFATDDARDLSGFGPKSDRSRTRCPPSSSARSPSFALPHRAKLARLREVDERRFAPPEHRPRWRRLVGRGIRIRARSRDGRGLRARRRLCRATCNRQLTGTRKSSRSSGRATRFGGYRGSAQSLVWASYIQRQQLRRTSCALGVSSPQPRRP
jgi:hypothetical protein